MCKLGSGPDDDGMREVWRLEALVAEQTAENRELEARNAVLEGEVQDLKRGLAAAEERARADLGMIAEGEPSTRLPRCPAQSASWRPRQETSD